MLQEEITRIIALTLAKQIEWSAALARQFGFLIPEDYELGFQCEALSEGRKSWIGLRIRLNDLSHEFVVPLLDSDDDPGFLRGLDRAAMETVMSYIDAHPETRPSREDADEIVARLKLAYESCARDEHLSDRASEVADAATYTEVRR